MTSYPLKMVCQQFGIGGFILVVVLLSVVAWASWSVIRKLNSHEHKQLASLFFLLLFLPAGLQWIKNLLPLAIFPTYPFYLLAFGQHAIVFSCAILGLLLGIQKDDLDAVNKSNNNH